MCRLSIQIFQVVYLKCQVYLLGPIILWPILVKSQQLQSLLSGFMGWV